MRSRPHPRNRPIHRRWHRNSPSLCWMQRLRRTRHVVARLLLLLLLYHLLLHLLHRLLTMRLPLHLCVFIRIPVQQRLLVLLRLVVVERDEAAIGACCCEVGDHAPGDLGCFFGYGAGVACGVGGVAAGVGVAAGGDEEGEVEESVGEGVLVCEIFSDEGMGG